MSGSFPTTIIVAV